MSHTIALLLQQFSVCLYWAAVGTEGNNLMAAFYGSTELDMFILQDGQMQRVFE